MPEMVRMPETVEWWSNSGRMESVNSGRIGAVARRRPPPAPNPAPAAAVRLHCRATAIKWSNCGQNGGKNRSDWVERSNLARLRRGRPAVPVKLGVKSGAGKRADGHEKKKKAPRKIRPAAQAGRNSRPPPRAQPRPAAALTAPPIATRAGLSRLPLGAAALTAPS